MKKVLIVDDDQAVTNYFLVFLMQTDLFEPVVINDSREVEGVLAEQTFDLVMLDMDMPNVTGMDILKMMRARGISIPVIILTGVSDVELAVKAMKQGAFDYLTKPVSDEQLLDTMNAALEHGAVHDTLGSIPAEATREDLQHAEIFRRLPTQDPETIRVLHQAEKIAQGDLSVFIWGERGTGKRWLARAIHRASARSDGPFVAMDPSSPMLNNFAVEVFGRAEDWSGQFPAVDGLLQKAGGGTLFINNIERLSMPDQVRLNRVLQGAEYYRENSTEILKCDVRFLVASSHDLTDPKYNESFSRDLLYHLMVNSIRIPALRDRPDDLPHIVAYFLEREAERTGQPVARCSDELLALLRPYHFPGNLQELQDIVASAAAAAEAGEIGIDALSTYARDKIALGAVGSDFVPRPLIRVILDHIRDTVGHCEGDRRKAARLLGIAPEELDVYLASEDAES